jgi:hypothetical protein
MPFESGKRIRGCRSFVVVEFLPEHQGLRKKLEQMRQPMIHSRSNEWSAAHLHPLKQGLRQLQFMSLRIDAVQP